MKKLLYLPLLLASQLLLAQSPPPKYAINGGARAVYFADRFNQTGDTTTLPRENSGHVLADLGVNVRPNAATEIQAMVRIRNDYGGFWGSGVSFDIRQLQVKGLIQNKFRYTLGDMDYALTPFTMHRTAPLLEATTHLPALALFQQQMAGYDVFMNPDGTWRTQGGSLDFNFLFRKGPERMKNSLFAMRLRPSFGGAATEQWSFGGRTEFLWKTFPLRIGGTAVSIRDLAGTSADTSLYASNVFTTDGGLGNGFLQLSWETGIGNATFRDAAATQKSDYFYTLGLQLGKSLRFNFREVGPDFFSPAAQTTAYNPIGTPQSFRLIGNDRAIRQASIYDFTREAGLYRSTWNSTLGNDQSTYLLLDPFGEATPNRRGVSASWQPKVSGLEALSVQLKVDRFSEIRGSGTSILTQFARAELTATYTLKNWVFSGMYRDQRAWRTSDNAEVPDLQLQQPWLSLNVGRQFSDNLRLDAGLLQLQSKGFVFDAERNAQNEIVNFVGRDMDYSELLPAFSLSYKAFGKSTLQLGFISSSISDAGSFFNIRSGFLAYFIQF